MMVSEALNFLAVKLFLVAYQLQTLGLAKSSSQTTERLPQLHVPMSSHNEAKLIHVQGVHTCTQYTCIYTIHIHVHMASHKGEHGQKTLHSRKDKQHQWPHLSPWLIGMKNYWWKLCINM